MYENRWDFSAFFGGINVERERERERETNQRGRGREEIESWAREISEIYRNRRPESGPESFEIARNRTGFGRKSVEKTREIVAFSSVFFLGGAEGDEENEGEEENGQEERKRRGKRGNLGHARGDRVGSADVVFVCFCLSSTEAAPLPLWSLCVGPYAVLMSFIPAPSSAFIPAPSLAFTRPCLSLSCLLCLGLPRIRGSKEPVRWDPACVCNLWVP